MTRRPLTGYDVAMKIAREPSYVKRRMLLEDYGMRELSPEESLALSVFCEAICFGALNVPATTDPLPLGGA